VGLLTIALDHLTLGRAGLYVAVLEGLAPGQLDFCRESLQLAVDGLRHAGVKTFVVGRLLTRAWLRSLTGALTGPESAQSDLDEAFDIAARADALIPGRHSFAPRAALWLAQRLAVPMGCTAR
jgi:hypothetical protein